MVFAEGLKFRVELIHPVFVSLPSQFGYSFSKLDHSYLVKTSVVENGTTYPFPLDLLKTSLSICLSGTSITAANHSRRITSTSRSRPRPIFFPRNHFLRLLQFTL